MNPNNLDVKSNVTGAVSVTLRDAHNNLVTNYPVTLGSTGTVTYSPVGNGNTDASGVFTATVSSTTVQSINLSAQFNSLSVTAPISFFSGTPSAIKSSLVVNPNNGILANHTANANAIITIRDSLGYPLPNLNVSVNAVATQSPGFFRTTVTDGNGMAVVPVTSSFIGPKSIAVHAGGVTLLGNANFVTPGPACAGVMEMGKPPMSYEYCDPRHGVVGDFDHDGNQDVVVSNHCGNVFIPSWGRGDGTYTLGGGIFPYFNLNFTVACDLNNDGIDDIVAAQDFDGYVVTYLGSSNRGSTLHTQFAQNVYAPGGLGFMPVSCVDFDG